jgi:hypothetical protein
MEAEELFSDLDVSFDSPSEAREHPAVILWLAVGGVYAFWYAVIAAAWFANAPWLVSGGDPDSTFAALMFPFGNIAGVAQQFVYFPLAAANNTALGIFLSLVLVVAFAFPLALTQVFGVWLASTGIAAAARRLRATAHRVVG